MVLKIGLTYLFDCFIENRFKLRIDHNGFNDAFVLSEFEICIEKRRI